MAIVAATLFAAASSGSRAGKLPGAEGGAGLGDRAGSDTR